MTLIDIRYVHERTRNIFIPWGGGGGGGGVGGRTFDAIQDT